VDARYAVPAPQAFEMSRPARKPSNEIVHPLAFANLGK